MLVLVALAVPFALSVSNRVETEVEGQTAGQAHLIAASVAGRLEERRRAARGSWGGPPTTSAGASWWSTRAGRLVADSAGPGLLGSRYGDRPEIAAVLAVGTVEQGRGGAARWTRSSSTPPCPWCTRAGALAPCA